MEKVSFKVSFTKQDQISQVRRFEVPQDCSTSYLYLKEKLRSIFSDELGTSSGLNITWQDHDEDIVSVESDEELIIAMHELKGPVYKFNVSSTIKTSSNDQGQERHPRSEEVHPGVICDGCQGGVAGFRYKCMTCFDFDLCRSCEVKGFHPGHNMMRIATPENAWPRHFINQLNKMQKSAAKSNVDESNQREPCRFPRGTGCPRSFGSGFHTRGAKRGCKVVPPPFCWISNQQYCNSINPEESLKKSKHCKTDEKNVTSPMNELFNIGEVMRATEEAVSAALSATTLNPNNKDKDKCPESNDKTSDSKKSDSSNNGINDLQHLGDVMKAVFGSFGVDLDVTKTNSDDNQQNPDQEESNDNTSEDKGKATDSNQTKDEEKKDTKKESGGKPIPVTVIEDDEDAPEAMEEAEMPLSPKVKVALQAMENMGFNNANNWLSDLLSKYDGDIGKVLDLINHAKSMRT